MTITNVIKDFIQCWSGFGAPGVCIDDDLVKVINNGDCGLAAIAVHYVLRERFNINTAILSNRSHCWLGYEKVDYDTLFPEGYGDTTANQVWSKGGLCNVNRDAFSDACNQWMPYDTHGAFLVKAFVERYGLKLPTELDHCIERAAEYEHPDVIPLLTGKYNAALQVPLPVITE